MNIERPVVDVDTVGTGAISRRDYARTTDASLYDVAKRRGFLSTDNGGEYRDRSVTR